MYRNSESIFRLGLLLLLMSASQATTRAQAVYEMPEGVESR